MGRAPGSSLLVWKPEHALGVPAVDYEHREPIDLITDLHAVPRLMAAHRGRELTDLINDLHASLFEAGAGTTVMDFLGELSAKASSHFALEEREMRDGRYSDYPARESDRERLLDEIRALMGGYEDGRRVDLARFAVELERWGRSEKFHPPYLKRFELREVDG